MVRGVVVNFLGPGAQIGLHLREVDDFDTALLQALHRAVAFRSGRQRAAGPANVRIRAHALAVAHVQLSAVHRQRRWVPAHRQKPEHFALRPLGDADYRHVVVIGIRDEQHLVVAIERQRVGRGALRRVGRQGRGDSLDGLPGLRIDHHHRVVVGAGDEQPPVFRERHVVGIVSDRDPPGDPQACRHRSHSPNRCPSSRRKASARRRSAPGRKG